MAATTMNLVVRTAKDAQLAKASAFLSAGYSVDGLIGSNKLLEETYIQLLQAACAGERMKRQSPLVNAGYALRVAAIMKQISSFLYYHEATGNAESREPQSSNLLVLGGGLDFLPLATLLSTRQSIIHVVEIDLKAIVEAKSEIITSKDFQNVLSSKAGHFAMNQQSDGFQINFADSKSTYTIIAGDLKNVAAVENSFGSLEDFENQRPTLVLSELVLAYIPASERTDLLQFLCAKFLRNSPESSLVLYEPLGSKVKEHDSAISVAKGYQQTYFGSFETKLTKGSSSTKQQHQSLDTTCTGDSSPNTTKEEEQSNTLFHPLAESSSKLTEILKPYRSICIPAERASQYIAPFVKSPEMFDEHAALRLYLRSYCLACIFDDSQPTLLERIMCPWSSHRPTMIPRHVNLTTHKLNQQSTSTNKNETLWITPIQTRDEEQVRSLFLESYQHLFKMYPSVQKMAKAALKKDLATTLNQTKRFSTIGQYYHDQNGIFLVAISSSSQSNVSSPKVLGSIGIRKCDATAEKGIRRQIPNATYEIHRLFVHPDYQSQGIARQLLTVALQELIREPKEAYVLATTLVLLEGAIRFYERQGFQIVEETDIANLRLRTYGKTLSPALAEISMFS